MGTGVGPVLAYVPYAEALDRLFNGQGHLLAERNALAEGTWLPPGAYRTSWVHNHPASYAGAIWMRVVPDPFFAGQRHRVEVRWRNWKLCREVALEDNGAWFVHTKGDDGQSIPLEVRVSPACQVAFGQGDPPGDPVVDINHGWSVWVVYDAMRVLREVRDACSTLVQRLRRKRGK